MKLTRAITLLALSAAAPSTYAGGPRKSASWSSSSDPADGKARGGIERCKYGGDHNDEEYLYDGEYLKRGEGICTEKYTFGITHGDGKLQLLKGKKVKWTAGVRKIDKCVMQRDGNFVCAEKNGKRVWALTCGGKHGAYLELNQDKSSGILRLRGNKESFKVTKGGKEGGKCCPKTKFPHW